MAADDASEPKTVEVGMRDPKQAPAWSAATDAELTGIEQHNTWNFVEAPPGANIIKCRYVFKIKRDATGA
jgi:hypothetical protein